MIELSVRQAIVGTQSVLCHDILKHAYGMHVHICVTPLNTVIADDTAVRPLSRLGTPQFVPRIFM